MIYAEINRITVFKTEVNKTDSLITLVESPKRYPKENLKKKLIEILPLEDEDVTFHTNLPLQSQLHKCLTENGNPYNVRDFSSMNNSKCGQVFIKLRDFYAGDMIQLPDSATIAKLNNYITNFERNEEITPELRAWLHWIEYAGDLTFNMQDVPTNTLVDVMYDFSFRP